MISQYSQQVTYNIQQMLLAYVREYKAEVDPIAAKEAYLVITMYEDLALSNPQDVIDNKRLFPYLLNIYLLCLLSSLKPSKDLMLAIGRRDLKSFKISD